MIQNKINILIIDDDRDMCESLKNILNDSGYNVNFITKPRLTLKELGKKNIPPHYT